MDDILKFISKYLIKCTENTGYYLYVNYRHYKTNPLRPGLVKHGPKLVQMSTVRKFQVLSLAV